MLMELQIMIMDCLRGCAGFLFVFYVAAVCWCI